MGTLGSRSTFHMGHRGASAPPRTRATSSRALAAEAGLPPGSNVAGRRDFPEALRHAGRQRHRHRHATCRATSRPIRKTGLSANVTPFWMIGGAGAEVEVDTETGQVRVTAARQRRRLPASRSIPRIARRSCPAPRSCSSASRCSRTWCSTAGRSPTPRSPTTRSPASATSRRWRTSWSTAEQSNGPFGAKGVGESGTFGVSPAIANAIDDAVGVRLISLPLTAERVLRALRAKQGRPLARSSPSTGARAPPRQAAPAISAIVRRRSCLVGPRRARDRDRRRVRIEARRAMARSRQARRSVRFGM